MLGLAARASLLAGFIALDALAPVRTSLEQVLVRAGVPDPLLSTVVVAAYALAIGLTGEILAFPFICRAEWLLERRYGLSRARFATWWGAHARTALVTSASWVVAAVVVYSAIGYWTTRWWLVVGAAFAAGTVALAIFGPILLRPALRARDRPQGGRGIRAGELAAAGGCDRAARQRGQ